MVVCIAHVPNFLNRKIFNGQFITSAYWERFSLDGIFGVFFFFMISGFVLGLGFANNYLVKKQKPNFKNYYLRRFIRIEPPYFIALLLFFLTLIFVVKKYSFSELLPHLLASLVYLHNPIYDSNSWILPVAWTLETEIQFYLIAPLLAQLYRINNRKWRWGMQILLILASTIYWYNIFTGIHVFKFLQYFLIGMLLADLYVENKKLPIREKYSSIIGIICCLAILFTIGYDNLGGYIIKYALMILLFHLVLTSEKLRSLFSLKFLALTGGMCYSIYLIHEQVMSATGQVIIFLGTKNTVVNFTLYFVTIIVSILIFSAIFFLFIEKPFMKFNIKKKVKVNFQRN